MESNERPAFGILAQNIVVYTYSYALSIAYVEPKIVYSDSMTIFNRTCFTSNRSGSDE